MNNDLALTTVCNLARDALAEMTVRLGRLQQEQQQALRQKMLLENYHKDYQKHLQQRALPGITFNHWKDYQQFMPFLQNSLQLQQQILQQSEQQLEQCRLHWHEKKQRLHALETLLKRQSTRQALRVARQEQKQTDEFSSRKPAGGAQCL